jgi:periplasmic protein TonB
VLKRYNVSLFGARQAGWPNEATVPIGPAGPRVTYGRVRRAGRPDEASVPAGPTRPRLAPDRALRAGWPGEKLVTFGAAGPRLAPDRTPSYGQRRPLAGSVLLHIAAGTLALLAVTVTLPPPPLQQTVALEWEHPTEPQSAPAPPAPPSPPPVAKQPPPQPAPPPQALPPPPAKPVPEIPPPQPTPEPTPVPVPNEVLPLPPPEAPPPPPRPRSVVRAPTPPAPVPAPVQQPARAPIQQAPPAPPAAAARVISPSWQRALESWLANHKVYPELARSRGEQGDVTVRFTVQHSGQVTDVTVVKSSGSPRLDAAAMTMLRGASVPPFDSAMVEEQITATVQIRYRLEQ